MARHVPTVERFLRYGAAGGVGFGLSLAATVTLHEVAGAPEELAFAVAQVMVFFFSFLTARHFIFDGSAGDPKRQLIRFALSSAGFRGGEYVGFLVLHTFLEIPYLVAVVVVLGTSFIVKFFFYGTVVFIDDA